MQTVFSIKFWLCIIVMFCDGQPCQLLLPQDNLLSAWLYGVPGPTQTSNPSPYPPHSLQHQGRWGICWLSLTSSCDGLDLCLSWFACEEERQQPLPFLSPSRWPLLPTDAQIPRHWCCSPLLRHPVVLPTTLVQQQTQTRTVGSHWKRAKYKWLTVLFFFTNSPVTLKTGQGPWKWYESEKTPTICLYFRSERWHIGPHHKNWGWQATSISV